MFIRLFVLVLFCAVSTNLNAASYDKIKNILSLYGTQAGFALSDLNGNQIFNYRGGEAFPPASVAKMISSACSLRTLGPQFQFETIFGYRGSIKGKVLVGDLVIQGSGDPSFVIEDLKEILEKIQVVYGIEEIKGKLIFDVSYFGTQALEISEGFAGDEGRSFTADITAIPFNFNSFSFWIAGLETGARVETLPRGAIDLKITNQVKALAAGPTEVIVGYNPGEGTARVSGRIAKGAEPKAVYRSHPSPYSYLAKTLVRAWSDLGGKWQAPAYQIELKPTKISLLYKHKSKQVSRLLLDINKLSTNFGAELVTLAAAVKESGRPAGFDKVKNLFSNCLLHYGIKGTDLYLENASGLSRKSTMKPLGLTSFLAKLQTETYFPEYLSSLATLGRDGTVASRLPQYAGRARLKSGSLQGVTTLAGYVFPQGNLPMSFALFFKCSNCDRSKLFNTEDEILKVLLED